MIVRRLLAVISLAISGFLILLLLLRFVPAELPSLLILGLSLTLLFFSALPVALILAFLARSRVALAVSGALCIGVLVWLGMVLLPKATSPFEGFTVITFNMGAKHEIMWDVESWLNTAPSDVVLAQETFNYQLRPGIESLRAVYPYQAIQRTEIGYRGNTTLSAYAILAEGREGFEPDSTFTRVVINYKGTLIAVYNVSLLAPFGLGSIAQPLSLITSFDVTVRNAQLTALLERIEDETLPMIVGGEFNVTEFDPAYDRLRAHLRDGFREAGSGLGFTFPFGGAYSFNGLIAPLLRMDYLWVGAGLQVAEARVLATIGSDRLPIIARIHLPAS